MPDIFASSEIRNLCVASLRRVHEDQGEVRSTRTSKANDKVKIVRALSNVLSEMDMSDSDVQHLQYILYKEFGLNCPEIIIRY